MPFLISYDNPEDRVAAGINAGLFKTKQAEQQMALQQRAADRADAAFDQRSDYQQGQLGLGQQRVDNQYAIAHQNNSRRVAELEFKKQRQGGLTIEDEEELKQRGRIELENLRQTGPGGRIPLFQQAEQGRNERYDRPSGGNLLQQQGRDADRQQRDAQFASRQEMAQKILEQRKVESQNDYEIAHQKAEETVRQFAQKAGKEKAEQAALQAKADPKVKTITAEINRVLDLLQFWSRKEAELIASGQDPAIAEKQIIALQQKHQQLQEQRNVEFNRALSKSTSTPTGGTSDESEDEHDLAAPQVNRKTGEKIAWCKTHKTWERIP